MLYPPFLLHEVDDDEWFVLDTGDDITEDTTDGRWGVAYAGYDATGQVLQVQAQSVPRRWLWRLVTTRRTRWQITVAPRPTDLPAATTMARTLVQSALTGWAARLQGTPDLPSTDEIAAASLPVLLGCMVRLRPVIPSIFMP